MIYIIVSLNVCRCKIFKNLFQNKYYLTNWAEKVEKEKTEKRKETYCWKAVFKSYFLKKEIYFKS